ncbi:MAG: hypothetical protein WCE73_09720 [Candidatus Angelobacter sp.]
MKKYLMILALAGLTAVLGIAKNNAPAADSKLVTMDAWISDEKCGATIDPACAKRCQEAGSKLVVVNNANKSVIPVANQDSVKPFIGQHVTVKGTMKDGALNIASVKPVAAEKAAASEKK